MKPRAEVLSSKARPKTKADQDNGTAEMITWA